MVRSAGKYMRMLSVSSRFWQGDYIERRKRGGWSLFPVYRKGGGVEVEGGFLGVEGGHQGCREAADRR